MPRLLLIYATNTGNTAKVAQAIAQSFDRHGLSLPLRNVTQARPEEALGRDLLILGSPTWDNTVNGRTKEGQLQDQMADFLIQLKKLNLQGRNIALFGLGDSSYKYFGGAVVYLQKFVTEIGGHLVLEPLLVDSQVADQQRVISQWSDALVAKISIHH